MRRELTQAGDGLQYSISARPCKSDQPAQDLPIEPGTCDLPYTHTPGFHGSYVFVNSIVFRLHYLDRGP
jgi:hypothetical protein